ncbi:MAG: tRNA-dihydrouridine synthase [Alphaproteobacteria bacterium]|nr:tRNA-dihydrouridine synthase [Alphaproteobacteria bacterium]MCL2890119.1 tRNA-dihydrouridine synthase [Alphaproteobacteria bacterium]
MFTSLHLKNMTINTPVFAAPLAGITDRPYRQILRKCAPDAPLLTEMISCHALINNRKPSPNTGNKRNFDNLSDEGLIGAQIFGADPAIMATGAKILEQNGASWIDINMGCPVPKVATKAGAGAFLMRDPKLAGHIVDAVVRSVKIPVSIKTRLGWDNSSLHSAELVRICADNGAQFATIHGRTRAQGYAGLADRMKSLDIKHTAPIPVMYNGDIKTTVDIAEIEKMGFDGAMVGRAILGNPWLMDELTRPGYKKPDSIGPIIIEHLHLTLEYYGVRAGVPLFRKHAAWYSAGMTGGAEFRTRINQIIDPAEMERAILEFFKI